TPRGAGSDVPPVSPSANVALFDGGVAGAYAVLQSLVSRCLKRGGAGEASREPARFDIASREVQVALNRQDLAGDPNEGRIDDRRLEHGPFLPLALQCSDGEITTHVADETWPAWCRLIGREELVDDPRFATKEARAQHADAITDLLEHWTRQHPQSEVEEAAQARGIPAATIVSPLRVLEDNQLRFRHFFAECTGADGRRATLASAFPSVTQARGRGPPRRLAPALGEHTAAFRDELGDGSEESGSLTSNGSAS